MTNLYTLSQCLAQSVMIGLKQNDRCSINVLESTTPDSPVKCLQITLVLLGKFAP